MCFGRTEPNASQSLDQLRYRRRFLNRLKLNLLSIAEVKRIQRQELSVLINSYLSLLLFKQNR